MSCVTIFIVIFGILSSVIIADDPCRFTDVKGTIDLSSLGRTDGTPAFPDKIPPTGSNYKYSYNPCRPFSEGAECRDVAACQVSMDGLFQFTLGTQESTVWNTGGGLGASPYVTYSSGDKRVRVDLECRGDEILEFEALGEDPINNYRFRLSHKCACWDGCVGLQTTTTTTITTTSSPDTSTVAPIACRFTDVKGTIDLSSLGRTDGTPAFPDKIPPTGSNYKYSYNPCRPFSEGNECRNVAACQVSMDGLFQFTLGTQESTVWNTGGGLGASPYVTYSSGDKRVRVDLECRRDEILEFEALGEDPINNYRFRLAHKCACWDGCVGPQRPTTTTTSSPETSTVAPTACRFVYGGDVIDLTSLGRTDGTPAFPDKIPPTGSNYKYSYNPCRPFSEGNECRNVAACQVSMDGVFQFALGTQESTVWNAGGGLGASPYVTYSSGDKRVRVDLDCRRDEILEFEALGEDPINNYRFRLAHKCACWNGCGVGL